MLFKEAKEAQPWPIRNGIVVAVLLFILQRQRQQRLAAAGPVGGYLAACAIIKNQHKDLPEWLEYHKWLGVSQFYIMDDGSDPPLDSVLQPYIQQGWVTHRLVGNHTALAQRMQNRTCAAFAPDKPQISAYNLCLQDYGHLHQWMSFTDADEFLVLTDGTPDLPTLLRDYESYGGLGANWKIFGSSGHLTRQPFALRAYTRCMPANYHKNRAVKTIGNMAYTAHVHGPHSIRAAPDHPVVTASGGVVKDAIAPTADYSRLALLHYQLKSRAEFEQKRKRGDPMSTGKQRYQEKFWTGINSRSKAKCREGVAAWKRWQNAKSAASGGSAASAGSLADRFAHLQQMVCRLRLVHEPQPPSGSGGSSSSSKGAPPGTALETSAKLRTDREPGVAAQRPKP
ncbi:hypothetical protein C2E20_1036 [Micractinium conductrix]|uniref:Glycosyltransferase family 92 protein n=1 Tax=Micractinium conductrix TaxID=554055 RepID=A0A2P6VMY7_9CHLO|nr:hypothetical protein C2E20_1036 [Micractinium conductrix]|eukprot:PSC75466.1 hypothetical protein C2E20_1036 [Micractinium conductrix]